MTLPTYVDKAAARRTVRTIDLEDRRLDVRPHRGRQQLARGAERPPGQEAADAAREARDRAVGS